MAEQENMAPNVPKVCLEPTDSKYLFRLKGCPSISTAFAKMKYKQSIQKVYGTYIAEKEPNKKLVELYWAESTKSSLLKYIEVNLKLLAITLEFVQASPTEEGISSFKLSEELLTKLEQQRNSVEYRNKVCRWWAANRDTALVLYMRNIDVEQHASLLNVYPLLQVLERVGSRSPSNLLSRVRDKGYSGLVVPWLYIGGTGSAFGIHLEDCILEGVNAMVPISEEGLSRLHQRIMAIFKELSFKRWHIFEGCEEQLLELQGWMEDAMGLQESDRSLSLESINSRKFFVDVESLDPAKFPFSVVDQQMWDVVVTSQAHMGTGFGGVNISWNCMPTERLQECVAFQDRHCARVRSRLCERVTHPHDVVAHAIKVLNSQSLLEVLQPTFPLVHFLKDVQELLEGQAEDEHIKQQVDDLMAGYLKTNERQPSFPMKKRRTIHAYPDEAFNCDVCRCSVLKYFFYVGKNGRCADCCVECVEALHDKFPDANVGMATIEVDMVEDA